MARQVLENGVILPAEYSDDWYDDMTSNLTKLDDVIGSDSEKLSSSDVGAAALSNNYNDLDNLPTIPTVNDATLTIQKNGVDVQTFTANASSNVTCNITVPTKTSDLTNDSNFVDTSNSAVASGITSAKVTDYDSHIADTDIHVTTADKNRWNNQTYVFRYSSTALTASSTNSNTLLDNTDNLKVGDKVIDSSGVLFSITAIDTQNSTFTIGTALIDLANDSDVVHRSGDETVGGVKTFADTPVFTSFDGIRFRCAHNSNAYITFRNTNQANPGSIILSAHDGSVGTAIHLVDKTLIPYNNNDTDLGSSSRSWKDFYSYHGYFRGQQQNDEYSGNARTNLTLTANRDILGQSGCLIDTFRENTSQGTGSHILGFGIKENSVRYQGCRLSWFYDNDNNGYVFALRPTTQGSNQPIKYELGTSSAKWSTINGLEPSSLGMPDLSNGIDISSYISYGADRYDSTYTVPDNGYITIYGTCGGTASGMIITNGNYAQSSYAVRRSDLVFYAGVTLPVSAGDVVTISTNNVTSLINAKFYPCQGNV